MRIIPNRDFPGAVLSCAKCLLLFPWEDILATTAQEVKFPLPPKLEELQDYKLMPGACEEAHCTCGMFMYKHLDSGLKNSTLCTIYLQPELNWACPLPSGDGLVI